jgi:hypothetical protein
VLVQFDRPITSETRAALFGAGIAPRATWARTLFLRARRPGRGRGGPGLRAAAALHAEEIRVEYKLPAVRRRQRARAAPSASTLGAAGRATSSSIPTSRGPGPTLLAARGVTVRDRLAWCMPW